MFTVDPRILESSFEITDWPLSRIFLKNHAAYAWLLLIPRLPNAQELSDLKLVDQQQLIKEITALSQIVKTYFNPDKINIATLGNIVSQLHIHVVGRFKTDPLWPHSIWQEALMPNPYMPHVKDKHLSALIELITQTAP